MSAPRQPSEESRTHVMMDGIIHNLARKQQRKASHSSKVRQHEPIASPSGLGYTLPISASSEEIISNPAFLHTIDKPRKGILKVPTVHFPEDVGMPEPFDAHLHLPLPVAHHPKSPEQKIPGPPLPPALPAPPPPPPSTSPRPPSLFSPLIETDEYLSQAAYNLYTKFIDELSQFVDQQSDVIRRRLRVQETRAELKRCRERVSQCDMQLINYVRECIPNGISSGDAHLLNLYESANSARDFVGPLESEYEPMEVALGAEEDKLKEKYIKIEERFEQFFRLRTTSTTKQSIPSNIEYEASTASWASATDMENLELEQNNSGRLYGMAIGDQVCIGQLPMLRDCGSMQEPALYKGKERPAISSDSAEYFKKPRDSASLDENGEEELLADILGIVGAESPEMSFARDLGASDRRISQSLQGLVCHSLDEAMDEPTILPDDLPLDRALQEVECVLLLDEQCDNQSILSNYLITFDNTRDRVNRWILHQLRISPREIFALRRMIIDYAPNTTDWATLSLIEWPNDTLGHGQSYCPDSVEEDSDRPVPGLQLFSRLE